MGTDCIDVSKEKLIDRLLQVFTPGQLLDLAHLMEDAIDIKYARIEMEIRNDRIFTSFSRSYDYGKVVGR